MVDTYNIGSSATEPRISDVGPSKSGTSNTTSLTRNGTIAVYRFLKDRRQLGAHESDNAVSCMYFENDQKLFP